MPGDLVVRYDIEGNMSGIGMVIGYDVSMYPYRHRVFWGDTEKVEAGAGGIRRVWVRSRNEAR